MPRLSVAKIMLVCCILLSMLLLWFASTSCRSALPVAQCFLRGIALSLGQAIESLTFRDTSLSLLKDFKSNDIAYFAVIDPGGRYLFHSNQDLIGEQVEDERWKPVFKQPVATEERRKLGTGETIFESQQQLHLAKGTLVLRLALHTWQADQIIRRARVGGGSIVILLVTAWIMAFFLLRLQRRALDHREQLAQQEQLAQLGALGAVLAHEVRTPLSGIKGYAQLLEERLDEPRQQRFAQKIVTEAARLEALVNELLTYSHQEAMPDGLAAVDEVVESAWEQIAAGAQMSGVTMEMHGLIEQPVSLFPDRLRQVLLNLLMNAVQAMPEGGVIRVSLFEGDEHATIVITDQGPGFGLDTLKNAFDPFYTTRPSGSGLGLAVCRKIVEGYGGTINAENSEEGGAMVTLVLPLAKEFV